MLPETLSHNLSPMNPGNVILEYALVIKEEKKIIDGITWSFSSWAHKFAEPKPDQLYPNLTAPCRINTFVQIKHNALLLALVF